jgi:hypothetical protein
LTCQFFKYDWRGIGVLSGIESSEITGIRMELSKKKKKKRMELSRAKAIGMGKRKLVSHWEPIAGILS